MIPTRMVARSPMAAGLVTRSIVSVMSRDDSAPARRGRAVERRPGAPCQKGMPASSRNAMTGPPIMSHPRSQRATIVSPWSGSMFTQPRNRSKRAEVADAVMRRRIAPDLEPVSVMAFAFRLRDGRREQLRGRGLEQAVREQRVGEAEQVRARRALAAPSDRAPVIRADLERACRPCRPVRRRARRGSPRTSGR